MERIKIQIVGKCIKGSPPHSLLPAVGKSIRLHKLLNELQEPLFVLFGKQKKIMDPNVVLNDKRKEKASYFNLLVRTNIFICIFMMGNFFTMPGRTDEGIHVRENPKCHRLFIRCLVCIFTVPDNMGNVWTSIFVCEFTYFFISDHHFQFAPLMITNKQTKRLEMEKCNQQHMLHCYMYSVWVGFWLCSHDHKQTLRNNRPW